MTSFKNKNLINEEITSLGDIELLNIEEEAKEYKDIENIEIISKITTAQNLLTEIDEYFESLSSLQSKKDEELSDLLHYIENNDLTPKQCIKIVDEIRKKRLERRTICNDIEIKRVYEENRNKIAFNNQRDLLISNIYKRAKNLNNEYKNRQYTDDDMKKMLKGELIKNV